MAFINAGKFRRYHGQNALMSVFDIKTLVLNARDLFRLPGSVLAARRVLKKFDADVMFSKGGFVAVPVGIAAKLLKIPIITHDSDSMPGLANRIIGRWAKMHATGMPADLYDYPKSRTRYVGIPIDEKIKKVTPRIQKQMRHQLGLAEDGDVVLLSGGGNGSKRLNDLMLAIAPELLRMNLSLSIIHLTGAAHEDAVKDEYSALPKSQRDRVSVLAFTSEFYACAAAADLVISRAGATTIAELAAAARPLILIPAPFLAGGHQTKNARALAEKDAAAVVDEDIGPDELLALINGLLGDDRRRFELAKNIYGTAKPDAAAALAKLILEQAGTA